MHHPFFRLFICVGDAQDDTDIGHGRVVVNYTSGDVGPVFRAGFGFRRGRRSARINVVECSGGGDGLYRICNVGMARISEE